MMKGIPRWQCPSLSIPGSVGYSDRLVPIKMVHPSFINCMSRHMIVIVVSEVLARMHVLYHPLSQRTQVLRLTDQLVTQSLGVV